MHKRENRRVIPNKDIYFRVNLNKGQHDLRSPSPLKLTKVMEEAKELSGVFTSMGDGKINSVAQVVSLIGDAGPRVLALMGLLVGDAWCHAEFDLDSDKKDFDSDLEFGEAVYEELHEESYSLQEIIMLVLAILDQAWDRNAIDQEALQKANFMQRLKGLQNSSGQISKSSGSDHGKEKDSKSSKKKTK